MVTSGLLKFGILLSLADKASISNFEMSAPDVVSCKWTQSSVLVFRCSIQIFVGLHRGSVGNGSSASNLYVVAVHLMFYLDTISGVARYILDENILETVRVV